MRLGDHPELFAAVMEALQGLPWATGVAVWATDSPPGYRVTVSTGDRFLTHQRTIVIPVKTAGTRNLAHVVKAQVDEMKLELDRVTQ